MPFADIKAWTECPECGSALAFDEYRENALECTSVTCDFTERDSIHSFTDFMSCPDCGYEFVETKGGNYRENGVRCKRCGLEEGDMYDR